MPTAGCTYHMFVCANSTTLQSSHLRMTTPLIGRVASRPPGPAGGTNLISMLGRPDCAVIHSTVNPTIVTAATPMPTSTQSDSRRSTGGSGGGAGGGGGGGGSIGFVFAGGIIT